MSRLPEFAMGFMLAGYIVGILIAEFLGLPALAAILLAVVLLGASGTRARTLCIVAALAVCVGGLRYSSYMKQDPSDIAGLQPQVIGFTGRISQEPERVNNNIRLVVRCSSAKTTLNKEKPVTGKVIVYMPAGHVDDPLPCDYGDKVFVNSQNYEIREASNPGQFSYKKYLQRQGVCSAAYVRAPSDITLLAEGTGNPFILLGIKVRNYLVRGIEKVVKGSEGGVMAGMVLGTYAFLPDRLYEAFARTGTLHLLAASGFNCVCLIIFATALFRVFRIRPHIRNLIIIAMLIVYLLVVGMKPSMERAVLMASMALMAIVVRRVPVYKNLLFAAAVILLLINPAELFDVGFELSFTAVVALVWLAPELDSLLGVGARLQSELLSCTSRIRAFGIRVLSLVYQTALATAAVTVLTIPLTAYYFNYASVVTLLTNVFMALTVYFIFLTGVVAGLFQFIPPVAAIAGFVGKWITKLALTVIYFFGDKEWSAIVVGSPTLLAILLYYAGIILLFLYVRYARGIWHP